MNLPSGLVLLVLTLETLEYPRYLTRPFQDSLTTYSSGLDNPMLLLPMIVAHVHKDRATEKKKKGKSKKKNKNGASRDRTGDLSKTQWADEVKASVERVPNYAMSPMLMAAPRAEGLCGCITPYDRDRHIAECPSSANPCQCPRVSSPLSRCSPRTVSRKVSGVYEVRVRLYDQTASKPPHSL